MRKYHIYCISQNEAQRAGFSFCKTALWTFPYYFGNVHHVHNSNDVQMMLKNKLKIRNMCKEYASSTWTFALSSHIMDIVVLKYDDVYFHLSMFCLNANHFGGQICHWV